MGMDVRAVQVDYFLASSDIVDENFDSEYYDLSTVNFQSPIDFWMAEVSLKLHRHHLKFENN